MNEIHRIPVIQGRRAERLRQTQQWKNPEVPINNYASEGKNVNDSANVARKPSSNQYTHANNIDLDGSFGRDISLTTSVSEPHVFIWVTEAKIARFVSRKGPKVTQVSMYGMGTSLQSYD